MDRSAADEAFDGLFRAEYPALVPAWSADRPEAAVDVDLQRAIAALSDGQRRAVVLHHLVDLPVDQVAR